MVYKSPDGTPPVGSSYAFSSGPQGIYNGAAQYPVWGGKTSSGQTFGMRFQVPSTIAGFMVHWYGHSNGSTGGMTLDLFEDDGNGHPKGPTPLETQQQAAASINATLGWQAPVTFTSTLQAGKLYWMVFSSLGGSASLNYIVGVGSAPYNEGVAYYTNGYNLNPPGNYFRWQTILWITDAVGNDLNIYPVISNPSTANLSNQTFVAPYSFQFDTVWVFAQDRAYDPKPLTLTVSGPGGVLGTGLLDTLSSYQKGMGADSWLPVSLDKVVQTNPGSTYTITTTYPSGTSGWFMFQLSANPQKAGFQGQGLWWAFQLSLGKIAYHNWESEDQHVADPVTTTSSLAVRFFNTAASNLTSVSPKVLNGGPAGTTLTASLYTDDGVGDYLSKPKAKVVSSAPITTASSGWPSIPLAFPLAANAYYWIVFSSNASVTLTRLVNPGVFKVLYSVNGGPFQTPPQGPTDTSIRIVTDQGEYRQMIDSNFYYYFGGSTWVAHSFTATNVSSIAGIAPLLGSGVEAGASAPTDCKLSLYSDNSGKPGALMASTSISRFHITIRGSVLGNFPTPVPVTPGTKYWFVLSALGKVQSWPHQYLQGFEGDMFENGSADMLVSTDSGTTWNLINGRKSHMLFTVFGQSAAPRSVTVSVGVKVQ